MMRSWTDSDLKALITVASSLSSFFTVSKFSIISVSSLFAPTSVLTVSSYIRFWSCGQTARCRRIPVLHVISNVFILVSTEDRENQMQ